MGFSSGASKAKREGKRQAAKAYYKALRETQNIEDLDRVDTRTRRQLDDALGDNLDGRTRRLAQKADKMAREIRKTEDQDYLLDGKTGSKRGNVKDAIGRYQERYAQLQDQLAGRTVKRFRVENPEPVQQGMLGAISTGPKPVDVDNVFSDQASAQSFATEMAANQLKKPQGLLGSSGMGGTNQPTYGMAGQSQQQPEGPRVVEETLQPLREFYREVPLLESAYNEMNTLAQRINNAPSVKMREQYGQIAQQLQSRVKKNIRDAENKPAAPGTGLLANELASAAPYSEVIR